MNEFLERFGDPFALLSSIVATWIISKRWSASLHASVRKYLIPFFYWGPTFLLCCMMLHCLQNGAKTVIALEANSKAFNFRYYSLQLFGCVMACQGLWLLQHCKLHISGNKRYNLSLYSSMLVIVVISLPTFIFTPIGIVPTFVLIITFICSLLVHKINTSKQIPVAAMQQPSAAGVNSLQLD